MITIKAHKNIIIAFITGVVLLKTVKFAIASVKRAYSATVSGIKGFFTKKAPAAPADATTEGAKS